MAVNPTVRLIATLSNLIRRKIHSLDRIPGLTPVQDAVLHFILGRCREQDLFQKHVEEEFNLRRSTATELLKLMEKKGLIYREGVSYDARLKKIMPTDKGHAGGAGLKGYPGNGTPGDQRHTRGGAGGLHCNGHKDDE